MTKHKIHKLLPCPFCASTDVHTYMQHLAGEIWGEDSARPCVKCNKCQAQGPTRYDAQDARDDWNIRYNL